MAVVPHRPTEHILIVEDDPIQCESLRATLAYCGYTCDTASTGAAAFDCLKAHQPDAILIDLGLPDCDGSELISILRRWTQVPVIVISGRCAEADKVAALDNGADDYVEKPFHPSELVARVRAKLRQYQSDQREVPDRPAGFEQEQCSDLSRMERALLSALVKDQGATVPEERLIAAVWGPQGGGTSLDLRVLVLKLRRKLELQRRPLYILNERGVGYYVSGWVRFPQPARSAAQAARETPEPGAQGAQQSEHSLVKDTVQTSTETGYEEARPDLRGMRR